MYNNYEEIQNRIYHRQDFIGNSATGRLVGSIYSIQSYNTIILKLDSYNCSIYFDNRIYSSTTSRIQNLIRRVLFKDPSVWKERKIHELKFI